MSFFFFKSKPVLSFVFDIRDSSISLSAVRFEKNKKPEMVLCKKFEISCNNIHDHKKYLSSMLKTIDRALISVRKDLVKIGNDDKIKGHYFFISSPWSISEAKTVKISKDRPFEINDEVLRKVLTDEEFGLEQIIENQTSIHDWQILEEKIVQSKLNGYKVDDIFGKRTSNLAIELFVSFIPHEVKIKLDNFVDEKISKDTKKNNNSSIISSYSFFRDLYSNKNDFIYVDIGKFVTDLYVVRDDIIFGVASIPFGEEAIIQTSISKSNLSRDIFLSQINIGQDKKFELPSHNRSSDLLNTGFVLWQDKLNGALSKICTEMNIPNNLFIITNSTVSNILAKEMSEKESGRRLEILGTKIETSIIGEGILNNLILNAKIFFNDPYVKMDIVFLDKILNN